MNIPGADFIKTSTGKEGVNAILPVGLVMVRAIRDYYQRTKHKVCVKSSTIILSDEMTPTSLTSLLYCLHYMFSLLLH